jgi:hypothetical protein
MREAQNDVWNKLLEGLKAQTNPSHTVNVHYLLDSLRHCHSMRQREDGQHNSYVERGDLMHALTEMVNYVNTTQGSPVVVESAHDPRYVIETLCHGLSEAESLLRRSRGCSTITTESIHTRYDTLETCIQSYKLLNS